MIQSLSYFGFGDVWNFQRFPKAFRFRRCLAVMHLIPHMAPPKITLILVLNCSNLPRYMDLMELGSFSVFLLRSPTPNRCPVSPFPLLGRSCCLTIQGGEVDNGGKNKTVMLELLMNRAVYSTIAMTVS